MASKLCDSCKSATGTLFCRADSAFLCLSCDSRIHAANKLASRHARVWVCEVCEQAPAHVTCKADAAALCVTCDRDIHSANPLARRHERLPVTPFYDSVSASLHSPAAPPPSSKTTANFLDENYFSDEEEAEAASWLLPNPNPNPNSTNTNINNKKVVMESPDLNTGQFMFADMDPYLDLDYVDPKQEEAQEQNSSGTDGVVPVHGKNLQVPLLTDQGCFELDFSSSIGSKAAFPTYAFNSTPCLSQSVSSSSLDVGVVPDGGSVGDISNPLSGHHHQQHGVIDQTTSTVPLSAVDREARVLRYREKRKNRKFEKTIRYASRKAYAETRPRIKGRFAKRTDLDVVDVDRSTSLFGFGVVPSF